MNKYVMSSIHFPELLIFTMFLKMTGELRQRTVILRRVVNRDLKLNQYAISA